METAIKESNIFSTWKKGYPQVGFFDYHLSSDEVFWDEQMHTICGLEPKSDVSKNEYFFSIVHPDDIEKVVADYQNNLSKGENTRFHNAFRIVVKGRILYTTTSGLLFRDDDGSVTRILGIVSNKTNELETQEALIHSEEKLRSILDYTPDNIFSVDRNYEITYINHVVPGLSKEKVVGKNVLDFVTSEDRELVSKILNKIFSNESSEEEFFTTYLAPKGREIQYYSKVTPMYKGMETIGATFISRDVTDQEQTSAKLAESEYMFRMLFESSTDKIFTIDKEWKINLINRPPIGLSRDTVLGKSILKMIAPADQKKVKSKLEILFKEKKAVEYTSIYSTDANGPLIHYSTRASPLIEDGEVYGAVMVSRDITHSVHQEEMLKAQSKELLRSNQNLEQFAYVSSHDMKAPVANLKSLISIMEDENVVMTAGQPVFEKLKQAVDQMSKTIVTLNEVFSVQSNLDLKREHVSVEDIFTQVTGSIENQLYESKATINTDFQLSFLEFPGVHLSSILQNLITNSVKYKHPERLPEITIKTYEEGGYSWLEVKDNGKGIDLKKHGRKIFGLFQRFDLSTEGKGIGLHIIKNIVENYGGEVILKSEPNKGTTFIIQLR